MKGMRDVLASAISRRAEEMNGFLRRLIAVPTENPPGREYAACVEVIVRELERLGLEPEVLEIPHGMADQGPTQAVRCFHGSGQPTLYFHGHYDVVPASPEQFEPREKGGKLFGRGSTDMKSGLVAMIHAVKALQDCNVELGGRIGLLMVPDEETGGALGSGPLARAGILGENGVGMLLPEPSSGVIWNANRGAITLRVTVKGKPAHVGLHFKGKNAFEGMIAAAGRLLELKREVETRSTGFRIAPEAARRSILLLGGECSGEPISMWSPTGCRSRSIAGSIPRRTWRWKKRGSWRCSKGFAGTGSISPGRSSRRGGPRAFRKTITWSGRSSRASRR